VLVAGIPAILRTTASLAPESAPAPILCGASEGFRRTWRPLLDRLRVREVLEQDLPRSLDLDRPVLLLVGDGLAPGDGLCRFSEEASRKGSPAIWTWRGRALAFFAPRARLFFSTAEPMPTSALRVALQDSEAPRVEAAEASWAPLSSAPEIAAAEERLYAGLGHDRDAFLSQFDRPVSIALSRRLARTNVTPNQITAASILVGIAGAALIAGRSYGTCLLGIGLAWFSAILDGCDGEIARLKLLSSEAGRQFDLFGDRVVNLSVLAAVFWHAHYKMPGSVIRPLALLLASGAGMSALVAWWLFQRGAHRRLRGLERIFQRLASRDFVYLIAVLAVLDRLEWFVYGAAFGSQIFWIGLAAVGAGRRLGAGDRLGGPSEEGPAGLEAVR
jgi:phosphatidylglycerophosphate synthase